MDGLRQNDDEIDIQNAASAGLNVHAERARERDEAAAVIGCICYELGATGLGQRHALCPAHNREPIVDVPANLGGS